MKKIIHNSLAIVSCFAALCGIASAQSLPYTSILNNQVDQNGNIQRTVTPTGGGVTGDYFYVDSNGQQQIDFPGLTTPGTATGIVVNFQQKIRRSMIKVTVPYTVFSAAAHNADVVIATVQLKCKIVGIIEDVTTAFTGGGETAATLQLGVTAGGSTLLVPSSCFTTSTFGLADADAGTAFTRAAQIQGGYIPSWTSSTNLSARLTTTTNNTSGLTSGSVTYYIITEQY